MNRQDLQLVKNIDNTWLDIEKAEQMHNATFVGEFSIQDKNGNWANQPISIFYQEEPPYPEYSNYFGLYYCPVRDHVYITSGHSAAETLWTGFISRDGKSVYYSRYRHDFIQDDYGDHIDGGPDYIKTNVAPNRLINFQIDGPDIKFEPTAAAYDVIW